MTEFLESQGIAYEIGEHGKAVAKTVILKVDGGLAMALIPVNHRPRLDLLKELVGAISMQPAAEHEVIEAFPGCDACAVPPFGVLHGMRVFVSSDVAKRDSIAVAAGSEHRLLKMAYSDYAGLVRPFVFPISSPDSERVGHEREERFATAGAR
jgi:Ala-tRNA(Pro) deacylase